MDRVVFWNKVEKTNGCWIWMGARNSDGYGNLQAEGRYWKAHRYAWYLLRGSVPSELDHLCSNRMCVNPDHLEGVTHAENNKRSGRRKRFCPQEHALTDENRYWNGKNNECLLCRRERNREYMRRKRAVA